MVVFLAGCDWGRTGPSRSRTQDAAFAGGKGKSEDAEMRSARCVIQVCPAGKTTISVVVRGLSVAEVRPRRLDDLREADHRYQIAGGDRPAVVLFEEVDLVLEAAELGVVVLDVAARELVYPLDLDVVDHRVEDLLPRAVAEADRDPDDLAALVLVALVAEPNRRGLATALQLVDEDRRVEVQNVDAAPHKRCERIGAGVLRGTWTIV